MFVVCCVVYVVVCFVCVSGVCVCMCMCMCVLYNATQNTWGVKKCEANQKQHC